MHGLEVAELKRFLTAYAPAQHIFREGEAGDVMYIVQEGRVHIQKEGTDPPLVLATMGEGEFFGEMALVDQSPRSASATAGPHGARLLAVDSAHFVYLVSQQPAFALIVLAVMASRLRSNNERWENLK